MEESTTEQSTDQIVKDALLQLIKLCREIINITSDNKANSNVVTTLLKFIKKYETIVHHTDIKDFIKIHGKYYTSLYYSYRKHFLEILEEDEFLRGSNKDCIQIWLGKLNDDKVLMKKDIRLPLSTCYSRAWSMHNDKARKLDGHTDNDAKIKSSTEYIIKFDFQYFLLKVIYYCLDEDCRDLETLYDIMQEIKDDTSLVENEETLRSNDMNGVLKSVMEKAAGGTISDGQSEKVMSLVKDTFNDEEIITTIKDSAKSSAQGTSIADHVSQVLKRVEPVISKRIGPRQQNQQPPQGVHKIQEDGEMDNQFEEIRKGVNEFTDMFLVNK